MIAVAVRHGAANATVTAVIEQAGVSRRTFYEHFTDRDLDRQLRVATLRRDLHDPLQEALLRFSTTCRPFTAAVE